MRRVPIRIRTFILGTVLLLLLVPTVAAGAAWSIERDHQQANIERRLNTAVAYLTSHRAEMQEQPSVRWVRPVARPARSARATGDREAG